ncbi:hypothetical protein GCM10018780_88490 [Streptomyces lanatus]|nr:hypothetical protein GCM10018780_88490 [Streptomyces lanatus]
MSPESTPLWQQRIEVAEQAVRGSDEALASLPDVVLTMDQDRGLLGTWQDASDMSYFLALLRELEGSAEIEFAGTVKVVQRWMGSRRVPEAYRCAVHNRIASVLAESGKPAEAFLALNTADPSTLAERAYTLVQLGMVTGMLGYGESARGCAQDAARLATEADGSAVWLEIRMRAAHLLFHSELRHGSAARSRIEGLVRELEEVCGRQIDRWGGDHPRALEALVIMTEARHEQARARGDEETAGRLTDVLAVAAQRSATLLGARHPQAKAARRAFEESMTRWQSQVQADYRRRSTLPLHVSGSERAGAGNYFYGDRVAMRSGHANTGIVKHQAGAVGSAPASADLIVTLQELHHLISELRDLVPPDTALVLDEHLPALTAATASQDIRPALLAVAAVASRVGAAGQSVLDSITRIVDLLGSPSPEVERDSQHQHFALVAVLLKEAHARVRALQVPESVRMALTRKLLVITAAAKHDAVDAARRLGTFMADLDEGRFPDEER